MDKLYLYLLNRKPTLEERKKYSLINLKLVNKEICQSDEYRKFIKDNYELIKSKIQVIFNIQFDIDEYVLFNTYDIFRKNNYSVIELDKYLINQKNKFFYELKIFFNKNKINCIYNYFNTKNILKKYINIGFVSQYTINDIIYSDDFYNFASKKLELLFKS